MGFSATEVLEPDQNPQCYPDPAIGRESEYLAVNYYLFRQWRSGPS